jgi:hypothetical protein
MRPRVAGDWKVDLARRHVVEGQVEDALDTHQLLTRLGSSTSSLDRLDFQVLGPGDRLCELELKAKHQRYNGWSRPGVAERDLFILDELALRKIIDGGRHAFLLVFDAPNRRWVLWGVMDLVLATKTRIARPLATGAGKVKGKVLLDLGESPSHHSHLVEALDAMAANIRMIDEHWSSIEPWPSHQLALGA